MAVRITDLAKQTQNLVNNNSPALLTAAGAVGTVTTAYLAAKASFRAADVIRYVDEERGTHEILRRELTRKDEAKLVWKLYIPAAISGVLTVSAVLGANRVSSRRATAVVTAYAISEKAFDEYKDKVIERFGEGKERAVRDDLAQDRVNARPLTNSSVIVTEGGEVMCYDAYTGRYFKSTVESIRKAQNDTNYQVMHEGSASLSDFYLRLGLPATMVSEEVGWNNDKLLDVMFSTVMSDDQKPCISIEFRIAPLRGFNMVF